MHAPGPALKCQAGKADGSCPNFSESRELAVARPRHREADGSMKLRHDKWA